MTHRDQPTRSTDGTRSGPRRAALSDTLPSIGPIGDAALAAGSQPDPDLPVIRTDEGAEPRPSGSSREIPAASADEKRKLGHPLDFALEAFRAICDEEIVAAAEPMFRRIGHLALLGTIVAAGAGGVLVHLRYGAPIASAAGLSAALVLLGLQYAAYRLLPVLPQLGSRSPSNLRSAAFCDCVALVLLVLGLGGLILGTAAAMATATWYLLVWAVAIFAMAEVGAGLLANPRLLGVVVTPDSRGAEEALGLAGVASKLLARTAPVVYGVGVSAGALAVLTTLLQGSAVLDPDEIDRHGTTNLLWATGLLATTAAWPLLAYLASSLGLLLVDVLRGLTEMAASSIDRTKRESHWAPTPNRGTVERAGRRRTVK